MKYYCCLRNDETKYVSRFLVTREDYTLTSDFNEVYFTGVFEALEAKVRKFPELKIRCFNGDVKAQPKGEGSKAALPGVNYAIRKMNLDS